MELLTSSSDMVTGEVGAVTPGTGLAKIGMHIREPGNILNYMILSAWLKFMGVAELLPSVTIG